MLITQFLLSDSSWALPRLAFERLLEQARISGVVGAAEVAALSRARAPARTDATVGVLSLIGVLTHRESLFSLVFGGTSLQTFTAEFRRMTESPAIDTILIDVDSPGGQVAGSPELAAVLREPRRQTVVAQVNDLAASAAYWIASAADEVVITPSGQVGSIGIVWQHTDVSKSDEAAGVKTTLIVAGEGKEDANVFEPLTDRARAEIQARVDYAYALFVADVARGRGVSTATVRDVWRARVVPATEAVSLGMADRVGTIEQTLARVATQPPPRRLSAAAQRAVCGIGT